FDAARPRHRGQPKARWWKGRFQLAGVRARAPGPGGTVLAEEGRDMTDTATGEMPIEPTPFPPPPDVAAEIDPAPAQADGGNQVRIMPNDTAAVVAPVDPNLLNQAIEHLGPLRRSVIDHLIDSVEQGAQSVAQILAAMPAGTTRGNIESALKR